MKNPDLFANAQAKLGVFLSFATKIHKKEPCHAHPSPSFKSKETPNLEC